MTRSRFIIFSVALYLLILIAGSVIFIFFMQQIIRTNKGNELTQTLEIERIKLETSVNSEIAIALKMVGSPLIQHYFSDPENLELKKEAFEEIAAYRSAFAGNTVFWVNDKDKMFYSDDNTPYFVDTKDKNNYWYLMTLNETEKYNFNINYNPDLKVTKLWINAPVFDNKHKPIGILGTGINLSDFVNAIYKGYTSKAELYLFNAAGEITGARDIELVTSKKNINEELKEVGIDIVAHAKNLSSNKAQTLDTKLGRIAINAIPLLGWYSVALMPDSISDYKTNMTGLFIVVMVVIAIIFVIFNVFMSAIFGNISRTITALGKMTEGGGDLTIRFEEHGKDEFGQMAKGLNRLMDRLQTTFINLRQNSDTLAGSAEELSSISRQLTSGAEAASSKTISVSSSIEEMSVNIRSIASTAEGASANVVDVTNAVEQVAGNINAMARSAKEASENAGEVAGAAEQMSTNMNTIAAAIEEMSMSISQISNNAGDARKVANEATVKSREATNAMSKLGIAAKEIGQVTDVIKKIADKTNLLALNATIEAASAGKAGKGFAVVAGEIKELANQSAQSADDIARRIKGIQAGTGEAVTVINNVSDIIDKINQSIELISNHVGQQTKASNEIANNVAQANIGTKRVAESVGEVAKGSKEIARNASQANFGAKHVADSMGEVAKGSKEIARNASEAAKGASEVSQNVIEMNQVTNESAQSASQINQGASELARLASDLKKVLSEFKM